MPPSTGTARTRTSRTSRSRKAPDPGDPTDPLNVSKPLKEFDEIPNVPEIKDSPADRLDGEYGQVVTVGQEPFWDSVTVTAFAVAMVVGAILGVPIGIFLHGRLH